MDKIILVVYFCASLIYAYAMRQLHYIRNRYGLGKRKIQKEEGRDVDVVLEKKRSLKKSLVLKLRESS